MIRYKNLLILPTYHDSLEFTTEIRNEFYRNPPDLIAVEFPENLKQDILTGVARLPKISVVLYYDEFLKTQLYIPITPVDSLVEAIRLGDEYGIPVEFIDIFIKNYNPPVIPLPDSYALHYISLKKFYSILNNTLGLKKRAKHYYQTKILNSDDSLQDTLKTGKEAEQWMQSSQELDEMRNLYMASRLHQIMVENSNATILVVIGLNHWEQIKILLDHKKIDLDLTAFQPEVKTTLLNIRNKDMPQLFQGIPNIIFQFEIFRHQQKMKWDDLENKQPPPELFQNFDVLEGIREILSKSIERYKIEYQERISIFKMQSLIKYARNLALIENQLVPNLFNLVLAAKSIINDDFAWIVYEESVNYPFSEDPAEIPTLELSNKGLFLNGKHFTLRRSIPIKLKAVKLPLKPKPKERYKGEWKDEWNKGRFQLVSHIPEDIFEEQYFHHIRDRSFEILRDTYKKTHKFSSTLMDGVDFRETIRNWPINQTIYVKEEISIHGSVDSVVIIFDPDNDPKSNSNTEKYPYKMMWYAEHSKESDLAFYSTFPGVNLVGPGISRIELGGVTSFYPPRNVPNIWSTRFQKEYPFIQSKAETLLTSALIFAQKKFITYVSASKPRQIFYTFAAKLNLNIIFIPLNRFNPNSLHSLRNLHIIAGKNKRKLAYKYINKRKI
ncbi:MAG: hypothetical protein K9W44_01900 [Candidatus Lokiarchaeota archaeon]|nr:hypothetical protein [Candidatus Harpocratesius repetitus]